jgi:L-asparaginase II
MGSLPEGLGTAKKVLDGSSRHREGFVRFLFTRTAWRRRKQRHRKGENHCKVRQDRDSILLSHIPKLL